MYGLGFPDKGFEALGCSVSGFGGLGFRDRGLCKQSADNPRG